MSPTASRRPLTAPGVRARKVRDGAEPLVMVTAYDAPGARIADEAGVDLILVGDSLAMVVLGYDDTLQVTVADIAHHAGAVARAKPARARRRRPAVDQLPRVGRGHRPQRRHAHPGRRPGGEARGRPQAPADDRGPRRRRDPGDGPPRPHAAVGARHGRIQGAGPRAPRPRSRWSTTPRRWPHAGCFAIVLEGVPDEVARMVTDAVDVPTIGIGAGPHCDGQVLVFHDVLGIEDRITPEVRAPLRLAQGRRRRGRSAAYADDVRSGRFPADDESYHLSAEVAETLGLYGSGRARRLKPLARRPRETGAPPAPRRLRSGAALLAVGLVLLAGATACSSSRPGVGQPRPPRPFRATVGAGPSRGTGGRRAPHHRVRRGRRAVPPGGGHEGVAGPGPDGRHRPHPRGLRRHALPVRRAHRHRVLDPRHPPAVVDRLLRRRGALRPSTDMAPCGTGTDCPTYAARSAYRTAVEVPQGRLGALGVGPGRRCGEWPGACPARP